MRLQQSAESEHYNHTKQQFKVFVCVNVHYARTGVLREHVVSCYAPCHRWDMRCRQLDHNPGRD
jgi:hypothetical protein